MHPRIKFWYDKFLALGIESEDAELMATLKFEVEKDRHLLDWLKQEGLSGLKIWSQIHYPTLYRWCEKAWKWITSLF